MGEKVTQLSKKLSQDEVVGLARIFIPPYVRVRDGNTQNVDGYWREVKSLNDLTPEERRSIVSKGRSPRVTVDAVRMQDERDRLTGRKPSFSIRRERDGGGYVVRGPGGGIYGTKVHVKTSEEAEQVRKNLQEGRNAFSHRFGSETVPGQGRLFSEVSSEFDRPKGADALYEPQKAPDVPLTRSGHRPLSSIASEIRRDWKKPNFAAVPYLDALDEMDDITDNYYADRAEAIVAYFLSNASSWRGETAKRVKAELNAILKRNRR